MARSTFDSIASEVHVQTGVDIEQSRVFVRDSFRELLEMNNWSWMLRRGVLSVAAPYSTGTVTLTHGLPNVTGIGTAWTSALIGLQFRPSINDPLYTISSVQSSTSLALDMGWGGLDATTPITYRITQTYITPPDDFFSFLSVAELTHGWRLWLNVDQSVIDRFDPRRASTSSTPVLLSPVSYSPSYSGRVFPALNVGDTGSSITTGGTYTGSDDALFTVTITNDGDGDTATFSWRKNDGAFVTGVDASSLGVELTEGVTVTTPSTSAYIGGDTFVIRVSAVANPGLPRYELYPTPSTSLALPFHYISRYPDIDDYGVVLPRYIPGNVVKESALAKCARYAGSADKPNAYAQVARAENHETRFQEMVVGLMRQDEEVYCRSVQQDTGMPYAPWPWAGGPSGGLGGGGLLDFDPLSIYPDW
jgi:hypothetical protein